MRYDVWREINPNDTPTEWERLGCALTAAGVNSLMRTANNNPAWHGHEIRVVAAEAGPDGEPEDWSARLQ